MLKVKSVTPEFVRHLPETLNEGVLYVSEEFATAAHLCCCGCKEEVITPLNPASWRLIKSGDTVSLTPSIGNWKFDCKSHYWIRNNQVVESHQISDKKIAMVIRNDRFEKAHYIDQLNKSAAPAEKPTSLPPRNELNKPSLFSKLAKWFFGED